MALLPITAVSPAPEAAALSSLSSSSLSSWLSTPGEQDRDDTDDISVELSDYGTYQLSPELLGPSLDTAAPREDLLSAAVFSADYEGNAAAREAALRMLSAERAAEVTAGLAAVHAPISPPDPATPATPIVVLGNGLNADGSVHPNLANRLLAAEKLAGQRPQAPVLVSGGATATGAVEAHAMRDWLIGRGMSAERILVEDQSFSTVSNARFSRQLLPEATSVTVVTSGNHLRRAVVDFTLAFGPGTMVTGAGAPNDPPTPQASNTGIYRDALDWYLG